MARVGTTQLGNQEGKVATKPLRCSGEKKLGTASISPTRIKPSVA